MLVITPAAAGLFPDPGTDLWPLFGSWIWTKMTTPTLRGASASHVSAAATQMRSSA